MERKKRKVLRQTETFLFLRPLNILLIHPNRKFWYIVGCLVETEKEEIIENALELVSSEYDELLFTQPDCR